MSRDERIGLIATAGLLLVVAGAMLPWSRIGGRGRSGFGTADTFIGLADRSLPDAIAWIGRWWYAPAVLVLIAWASVFLAGRRWIRLAGATLTAIAGAMWWLFVWAAHHWDVLDVRPLGPVVATLGLVTLAAACLRRRTSLLAASPRKPSASSPRAS